MAKLSGNYEVVYILDPALGEEAIAPAVCQWLRDDDYIITTHRGHGHMIAKGLDIAPPAHYFTDGPDSAVNMSWSGAANLLYYNWLNYYVYQITPFEIGDIKK